jgi:hypothetical protein
MDPLHQFPARTGKRIFFFAGNQLVQGLETVIAKAAIKRF